MAYSSTVSVSRAGDRVRVSVTETEAASGTEATLDIGLPYLTLISQEQDLTAGSGTTVAGSLSTKSGGTAGDGLMYSASASAGSLSSGLNVAIYSAAGKLYHKANPASASDNSVTTVYLFKVGW